MFSCLVLLVMGVAQFHLPHSDSTPHGSPCPWTPLGRFHQTPGESGRKKDQINIADKLPASFTSISEEFHHSLSSFGKEGVSTESKNRCILQKLLVVAAVLLSNSNSEQQCKVWVTSSSGWLTYSNNAHCSTSYQQTQTGPQLLPSILSAEGWQSFKKLFQV